MECDHGQPPAICGGDRSFTSLLSLPNGLDVSVHVPGEYSTTRLGFNRSRQDIVEEMYLHVSIPLHSYLPKDEAVNSTLHCQASATGGYFEPGNHFNGHTAGSLLVKWPSKTKIIHNFNEKWTNNTFDAADLPGEE